MGTMAVSTAVARIRSAGHDIAADYTDDRCLEFLNTAIQQVASLLIAASWPTLVKEITVHNGDSLPENYTKAAGRYPLRMTDGRVQIVDDMYDTVRFRYFATPANLKHTDDVLPFNHDGINEVVVRSAIILALNENEFDISQDSSLLNQLQQAIASGMA